MTCHCKGARAIDAKCLGVVLRNGADAQGLKPDLGCPVQEGEGLLVLQAFDVLVEPCHEQEHGQVLANEYLERAGKRAHVWVVNDLVDGYEQALVFVLDNSQHAFEGDLHIDDGLRSLDMKSHPKERQVDLRLREELRQVLSAVEFCDQAMQEVLLDA